MSIVYRRALRAHPEKTMRRANLRGINARRTAGPSLAGEVTLGSMRYNLGIPI